MTLETTNVKKRPFSPDTKTTSFSVDQSAGLQTQHDAAVPSATSSEINLLQDSKRAKVDATEQNVAEEAKINMASGTDVDKKKNDEGPIDEEARKKIRDVLDRMQLGEGQRDAVEAKIIDNKTKKIKGDILVINDTRLLDYPKKASNVFLGNVVYTGARSLNPYSNRAADLQLYLLPQFTSNSHFATIEVRIPSEFLTYRGNMAVRKSAVWGTDIYTDDSDVVAVIIHSGHYRPVDAPDPSALEQQRIDGKLTTEYNASKRTPKDGQPGAMSPIVGPIKPLVAIPDPVTSGGNFLFPNHDLHVTLRILPKLMKYTGSNRFGLDSRGWGASHDGESIHVEKVEKVPRGSVGRKGRKVFSKKWGELAKSVTKDDDSLYSESINLERSTDGELEDELTVIFSESAGVPGIKYSLKLMTDWPSHLLNLLNYTKPTENDTQAVSEGDIKEGIFSQQELEPLKGLPYWRIKLTKFTCFLETTDGVLYELKSDDAATNGNSVFIFSVIQKDDSSTVTHRVEAESLLWTEVGFKIAVPDSPSVSVNVKSVAWRNK